MGLGTVAAEDKKEPGNQAAAKRRPDSVRDQD
jgi:hypothetical protein